MAFGFVKRIFPSWQSAGLAVVAAVLLILAFPDFDYWFLAWFALVPLMWAVEREKASVVRSFITGWLFGAVFFFGTCWWLTFAPITYAHFPPWLAYSGMVFVALIVGVFPALFAGILSVLLRRFGSWAFVGAPFVWVFTEFLRYWVTGNNWNAIGYSQAFLPEWTILLVPFRFNSAGIGGIYLVSLFPVLTSSLTVYFVSKKKIAAPAVACVFLFLFASIGLFRSFIYPFSNSRQPPTVSAQIVALQPNVPMSGLDFTKYDQLRQRQIELAEQEIKKVTTDHRSPIAVILPESPMNFTYNDDREFQQFIGDFARRNNVSVLFNSAEPDLGTTKYFNSAVMVGPDGKEAAQYDKIFLLPFGEAVPSPLEGILPGFVGNFAYGREYDILPVGDAKAGVMICFESHFGALSREYVRNGADVIIEMTNDGYLGPTPVLRQHLANAVFRAVETNRPVIRVTNVGVTAYINERGLVLNEAPVYQEATRVWSVSKSDGSQTFYVKYGDWFAWLCVIVTLGLVVFSGRMRKAETRV